MDEIESDEALRFYHYLNYLDGSSFGTGSCDEFVKGMMSLGEIMRTQNSKDIQTRGSRESDAINGEKGVSIKTVLEISTVITKRRRKYYCTGEVKKPIINGKVICKDRILIPLCGDACGNAIMYWHPDLTEEHYCVGGLESHVPVAIMDDGDFNCKGDDYSKREFLLACELFEDQEAPLADLIEYYVEAEQDTTAFRQSTSYSPSYR